MSQTKAQLLDNIKDDVQLDARKSLRFADTDSSHYVAFKAPATVSSNVTWTLPAADGSANYVLATDGSGTLSWIADPAGQWVTSGSNIYFTAGNVGIGDNSPSNPLSVTGASAFNGDVQFTGASYNVTWDKSADDLIFNDNAKAAFGTGSDLQIYYTGSAGWIYQSESGNDVSLGANGGNVWLRTGASANDDAIKCVSDGEVQLYFNGNEKLNTVTDGINLTGSLQFGDDTDTYLSRAAANTLAITTGGTERVRVDSSGNVGIGTSPATIMHVKANSGDMLRLDRDNAGAVGNQIAFRHKDGSNALIETGAINCVSASNAASAEFRISTKPSGSSNSEKIRVTQAGNVNIGGEFSQTDSKVSILDVTRPIAEATLNLQSSTSTGAADTGPVLRFYGHDGSSARYHASIKGAKENATSGNYAGYLAFNTRPNGGSMTERVRIDASGRVGIGTTSPQVELHIADATPILRIEDTTNNFYGHVSADDGGNLILDGDAGNGSSGSAVIMKTDGTERARFTVDGHLGIATASPSCRLSVHSATEFTAFDGATPSVTACMAQLYNNPPNETTNDHASLQFGVNGGTHNRVASISAVAESASNRKLAFVLCTDSGSNRNERLRVTGDGNVGIGTAGNVDNLLHAEQSGTGSVAKFQTGGRESSILIQNDARTWKVVNYDYGDDGSDHLGFHDGTTDRFIIANNGNIGIGTSTPTNVNDYLGITIKGTGSSKAGFVSFLDTSNNEDGRIFVADGELHIWADPSDNTGSSEIVFKVDQGEKFRIGGSQINLNNTNTNQAVFTNAHSDAAGATNLCGIFKHNEGPFDIHTGSGTGSVNAVRIWTSNGGQGGSSYAAQKLQIQSDGDVFNTNGTYGTISDIKVKQDVTDASSQWADIKAIKVRNFKYKSDVANLGADKALTQIGVVAQELEASGMTKLVKAVPDIEDGVDKGTVTKYAKSSILHMKALKALQEAMSRIETLETEVTALKSS